jgi:hypothetical protein
MHEVEEQELLAHALELPSKQVTPPPAPEVRHGGVGAPVTQPASMAMADKGQPVSD